MVVALFTVDVNYLNRRKVLLLEIFIDQTRPLSEVPISGIKTLKFDCYMISKALICACFDAEYFAKKHT